MEDPTPVPPADLATRRRRLPARNLPVRYYAFAHLCLAGAAATLVLFPQRVGGFYYHPAMLAVVHLVTLGWISGSILGSLYLVAPMALRAPFPARATDHWAQGLVVVGTSGMASHFWLDESSGMVWSAALVVAGLGLVAIRFLVVLGASPVPSANKLPFRLAFANLLLAATLGLLLGLDKTIDVFPGHVLDNVAGHAHLAVLGWATMTVLGAGYRLLPMLLPAAMPPEGGIWSSVLLLEAGTLGVAGSLLWWRRGLVPAAILVIAGLVVFIALLVWMRRHQRPAPRTLRRPDLALGQVFAAFAYLVVAGAVGLAIAASGPAQWRLQAILVYGVCGLLGFVGQLIAGVLFRLIPLYAWFRGFADRGLTSGPAPPPTMVRRPVHIVVLLGWLAAVPLLAIGLAGDRLLVVRLGGGALLTAVGIGGWELWSILRRARAQGTATAGRGVDLRAGNAG